MTGSDGPGMRVGANGWDSAVDVRQLRALLALVEHGSVGRAAEALGLAQSTVSEALAALDRAVGAPTVLRRRGAHRTALTAAGEALLPYARRVLQELDAAHLAIAAVTRGASANVEVIANESVSSYLLPPVLGALRRRWPNTRFAVSIATCEGVRARVAEGNCDLGLHLEEDGPTDPAADSPRPRTGGSPERSVLTRGVPLVIFSGPGHPLAQVARRAPLRRDEISPFPLFVSDAAGDFYELLRRHLTAGGLSGPRLEPAGSIDAVKRGVAADPSALGILPRYAVAEELRNGLAHALTLTPPVPGMRLVALLSAARTPSHPATTELLDQLREVLG